MFATIREGHFAYALAFVCVALFFLFIGRAEAGNTITVTRGPQVPAANIWWQVVAGSGVCDGSTTYPNLSDGVRLAWAAPHNLNGNLSFNQLNANPGTYTFTCTHSTNGVSDTATLIVNDCTLPSVWNTTTNSCGAPPPVTVPTLSSPTHANITSSSATLGATITGNGGASIIARGTCWGTTNPPSSNCMNEGGTVVSVFSHGRTGMPANTVIYYRGFATNGAGTGYSSVSQFTTLSAAANTPPVVNAGSVSPITLPTSSASPVGASASDPDGINSTTWSFVSGPGPTPGISNNTSLTPTFIGMTTAGTYTFNLTATDSLGAAGVGTVSVVVNPAAAIGADLTAVNTSPASGAVINNPASVTFTGTLTNSGGTPTPAGQNIWADVEIDWNQSNCAVATSEAVMNAGGPWASLAPATPQPMSVTLSAASSQLRNGSHCYRMIVDRDNLVTESNDLNNAGPWRPITISGLPQCSDAIDNDGDGTIDYPADLSCPNDSGNESYACTGSIPANAQAHSATESTGLSVDTPWTYSASDTATKCQFECSSGGWTGSACVAPSITRFEICDLGMDDASCATTRDVPASTPMTIRWESNADTCSGLGFNTGTLSDGQTNVTADPQPGGNNTYQLICEIGGTPTTPPAPTITLNSNEEDPQLTISRMVVQVGDRVDIDWDTRNELAGGEGICTLTGGGQSIVVNAADGLTTGSINNVTINARTTFVLTCDGRSDRVTVDVIAQNWES